jgi:hypothetical protein
MRSQLIKSSDWSILLDSGEDVATFAEAYDDCTVQNGYWYDSMNWTSSACGQVNRGNDVFGRFTAGYYRVSGTFSYAHADSPAITA